MGHRGKGTGKSWGWAVGLARWLFEQSGLVAILGTAAVASLSAVSEPVRTFAAGHPWWVALFVILLAFSLYGMWEASMKLWRWFRRKPEAASRLAPSPVPEPDPLPPGTDFTLYLRDRFPLRMNLVNGVFAGLGCRWKWDGTRIVEPAFRCPDCWEVPTVDFAPRSIRGTRFRCEQCRFEAIHPKDAGDVLDELARQAREKARDGSWRAVVAREMHPKGNAL